MTRSMNKPASPKHCNTGLGSRGVRHPERGICKRQSGSPVARSVKLLTNGSSAPTQQDCVSKLKKLLPKTNGDEEMSELALVEKTIAYISYLESVLKSTNTQELTIQTTVDLFQQMAV